MIDGSRKPSEKGGYKQNNNINSTCSSDSGTTQTRLHQMPQNLVNGQQNGITQNILQQQSDLVVQAPERTTSIINNPGLKKTNSIRLLGNEEEAVNPQIQQIRDLYSGSNSSNMSQHQQQQQQQHFHKAITFTTNPEIASSNPGGTTNQIKLTYTPVTFNLTAAAVANWKIATLKLMLHCSSYSKC